VHAHFICGGFSSGTLGTGTGIAGRLPNLVGRTGQTGRWKGDNVDV